MVLASVLLIFSRDHPAAIPITVKAIDDTSNFDEFPDLELKKKALKKAHRTEFYRDLTAENFGGNIDVILFTIYSQLHVNMSGVEGGDGVGVRFH
ncbi:serine/threonine-protein kinase sax-1-like [Corticium candelabrum]|uniref:serine/threonine-protein kinase sax-1-like n=1 Tax=Corticium candelabrum TaxID=121492 RepID=UPI002E27086F|nr:serine/threonine-protein kinase sax-1-like [Corticium candelabrum]